MNCISKLFLFALASFYSAGAFADSVCIKNKQGVIEVWQVIDRSTVENAVPCPPQQVAKTPAQNPQPQVTRTPAQNLPPQVTTTALQNPPIPRPQVANDRATVQSNSTSTVNMDQWSSSPKDLNIRNLIDTWSIKASWKLIWAVDKDIPLVSDVKVSGDFKSAVRQVLDSTTLSDVSLKPCFYTNQVVRVVRETTKCNPNE